MIIKKKLLDQPIVIDLTGPEGNAYVLLGYVQNFGKQLDMSKEQIINIQKQMIESNYENLVAVFDHYFGEYVTLLR